MEIIKANIIGFCNGVNYSVSKAFELLKEYDELYCLGEIVHNEIVINNLLKSGLKFIDSIDEAPDNSTVIFRAHGEAVNVYEEARKRNIDIKDLTCGKVRLIHKKIENHSDSFVIIIGKPTHPEIIGSASHAKNYFIVNNLDDINNALEEYNKQEFKKIYVCVQTTYSVDKYNELIKVIENTFNADIEYDDTICDSTINRQKEVEEIAKTTDKLLVIGGKNSSNTKELYNKAIPYCINTYLVQDVNDLNDIEFIDTDRVGIVSGASTSEETVNEIINYLNK